MGKSSTSFAMGNKFSYGNKGGRPPKFKSAEELEAKIVEYFDQVGWTKEADMDEPIYVNPSVNGLAIYLGFSGKQGLYDNRSKPEFSFLIKKAISIVELHYEESLNSKSCTGAIFALKNMGWKDKQEIESTNINLNSELDEEHKKEALEKIKKGLDEFKDYE